MLNPAWHVTASAPYPLMKIPTFTSASGMRSECVGFNVPLDT